MNILKCTIHWFAILRALYFRNLFGPATEKVWPYFRVTYNVLKIYRHWALLLHYPRWGISSQASFPRAEVRLAQTPEQHCSLVSLGWLPFLSPVIQELGREGILPYSSIFASSQPFNAPLAGLFAQYLVSCTFLFAVPPGDAYLFLISCKPFLILCLIFHAKYYLKCLRTLFLLLTRLCPSVCSFYILDVTVHGIGTLLSEHRKLLWSSFSFPIYF